MAGAANLLTTRRSGFRYTTAGIYRRLVDAFSHQGVSDQAASTYITQHGSPTWRDVSRGLSECPSCPKLRSYWHFHGCRYLKTAQSCAEPNHFQHCPLPRHELRNGRLNQTAYSLFLFARDVAGGDLPGWIDRQVAAVTADGQPVTPHSIEQALIGPLRNVYGVSDKVLGMALSSLLLERSAMGHGNAAVGINMVAVDTLVHNFLHRTGLLHRLGKRHAYGPACYRPGGCAEIIRLVADRIDARQFNGSYPRVFPRFVQHAIWRYCSEQGRDVCNGNRLDDRRRCQNRHCQISRICQRKRLK